MSDLREKVAEALWREHMPRPGGMTLAEDRDDVQDIYARLADAGIAVVVEACAEVAEEDADGRGVLAEAAFRSGASIERDRQMEARDAGLRIADAIRALAKGAG